jgi:hypothetical protein
LAKILFSYENPPGSAYIRGSQDSLGIVMPGINNLWDDAGSYRPGRIEGFTHTPTERWLEDRLCLLPLSLRESGYSVKINTDINPFKAKALAQASGPKLLPSKAYQPNIFKQK